MVKCVPPKIEALHRLINWFNLNHNSSIPLLGIDTTPLSELVVKRNVLGCPSIGSAPHLRWIRRI